MTAVSRFHRHCAQHRLQPLFLADRFNGLAQDNKGRQVKYSVDTGRNARAWSYPLKRGDAIFADVLRAILIAQGRLYWTAR